jgi:hypothetical protein
MAQETEAFEVIVGTYLRENRDMAIAQASKVLSEIHEYSDGDLFEVNVYGGGDQQIAVGLCFNTDIQTGDDYGLEKFMNACTEHRHVESVERVSFVPA